MHAEKSYQWLWLTVSAFLFNAAFFSPEYMDWLVFIFLIPLFYAVLCYETMSWRAGFYWGAIFFTGHWSGFFEVIQEFGKGSYKLFLIPALIAYGALQTSCWFGIASFISRLCCKQSIGKLTVWSFMTFCYFVWLYRGLLIIFGSCLGYCLGLPLIPLAEHPQWLALLPIMTSYGLLACLICSSMVVAVGLFTRNQMWILLVVLCFIPFIYGWVVTSQTTIPSYVGILGYSKPPRLGGDNPLDYAQEISNLIGNLLEIRPEISVVVLPESSFPFPLNEHPQLIELITNSDYMEGLSVILGAHRLSDNTLYNTVYVLQDTCITGSYDKKNLMPLTEYIPHPWSLFSWANNLFLKGKKEFTSQNGISCSLTINSRLSLIPLICSDLFLASSSPTNSLPILCIVNDSWFSMPYIRTNMLLYARFKAIETRCDIIYCSHFIGCWLGKNGEIIPI